MALLLAYRNTVHDFSKTLLSIIGIVAAIVLIFMQLGFRGAVVTTSTSLFKGLDFDLALRSKNYLQLVDSGQIDRKWVDVLRSFPETKSVTPLDIGVAQWRRPSDGTSRAIMLLGFEPTDEVFLPNENAPDLSELAGPDSFLIDTATHPSFEPTGGTRFGKEDVGREVEINQVVLKISGTYQLGTGLAVNGSGIVNREAFQSIFPHHGIDDASLILVKVDPKLKQEQELEGIAIRIQKRLGNSESLSFQVITHKQLEQNETERWLYQTPIGLIFTLGVIVSTVIGGVIVYMVLVSDVRKKLHEYATLGAIGYSNTFLASVVLFQAMLLSLYAFVPSLALAYGLYELTGQLATVPLDLNWERTVFVLCLTLAMSSVSGLLAVTKLWKAEPASLF